MGVHIPTLPDATPGIERGTSFRVARQGKHIVMTDGERILTVPRNNPVNRG